MISVSNIYTFQMLTSSQNQLSSEHHSLSDSFQMNYASLTDQLTPPIFLGIQGVWPISGQVCFRLKILIHKVSFESSGVMTNQDWLNHSPRKVMDTQFTQFSSLKLFIFLFFWYKQKGMSEPLAYTGEKIVCIHGRGPPTNAGE